MQNVGRQNWKKREIIFSLVTPCSKLHEDKTDENQDDMAALCLLLNIYALLQAFTLIERSELVELGWKLMLNIFVSALSNFFLLSGSKFQLEEKPLVKPHHFTVRTLEPNWRPS